MKKFSDIFSSVQRIINKVGNRLATTALFMVAAVTMGFTQTPDFTFIEGSVHGFKVENHPGNTFAWDVRDASFGVIDSLAFTFIEGQFESDVTLRFNDRNRVSGELVHLAVTETNPNGCSTTRALRIMLEPNNMYLEFASANTQDCFNMSDYLAPLKIGLNFKDKAAGVPIDSSFFPLKVTYTVENLTAGTLPVPGNGGDSLTITFNSANDYYLSVKMPEAVGVPDKTTEYELTITSVTDRYDTNITNNSGDVRIQIRVINHLPQSGNMDMALAYYIIK
jgi:hypothetical protein